MFDKEYSEILRLAFYRIHEKEKGEEFGFQDLFFPNEWNKILEMDTQNTQKSFQKSLGKEFKSIMNSTIVNDKSKNNGRKICDILGIEVYNNKKGDNYVLQKYKKL